MLDKAAHFVQLAHHGRQLRTAQETVIVQGQHIAQGFRAVQEEGLLQDVDFAFQQVQRAAVALADVAVDQAAVEGVDGDLFVAGAGKQDLLAGQLLHRLAEIDAAHLRHGIIDHQHRGNGEALLLAGDAVDALHVDRDIALVGLLAVDIEADAQRQAGAARAGMQPDQGFGGVAEAAAGLRSQVVAQAAQEGRTVVDQHDGRRVGVDGQFHGLPGIRRAKWLNLHDAGECRGFD
ncbi:hypothetical protein MJ904_00430 [Massilia sp. MB5]|uniref:hypothetical protein n=1 Tax=Massilia sp. MB5 TaxID=2919578 RepID=UPI001F0E7798|nr:hypothetical protein [Massilia sp. MB5]UMR30781.1 hypothetical protein MJ904_00430 [Massilia sp. MB5]